MTHHTLCLHVTADKHNNCHRVKDETLVNFFKRYEQFYPLVYFVNRYNAISL